MALGSARSRVMQMVLREVSGLVIAGVLIGAIGVMTSMKLIESFLFGLTPTDPLMLAISAVTLGGVALLAGAIPAWRAGRVDPMDALREE
jgi:ABC-type antimicrobial peptide transport system permease subunit